MTLVRIWRFLQQLQQLFYVPVTRGPQDLNARPGGPQAFHSYFEQYFLKIVGIGFFHTTSIIS